MKTSENHIAHKLGANRRDPARKEHRAKNPSAESRDVREDRSTRKSKLATGVRSGHAEGMLTARQLLARDSDQPWARALAASSATSAARKPVSLRLRHDAAVAVFVAGTFNNWEPERDMMCRNESGEWSIDLKLEPGRHEYLFIADGCWLPDPNADEWVENPHGGRNSVLAF